MSPRLLLLATCCLFAGLLAAQERPQETKPAPSPDRQIEIRDSIRSRVRFVKTDRDDDKDGISYTADRALLMPRMERASIFRIGIPGFLMRLGLRGGREDFDSDEEYAAVRQLLKRVRGLRVAAFADNPAYDERTLREEYARFVKRKRSEPAMFVMSPEGGVSIDVKQNRRGVVRLISLLAYGEEGAAVIRFKTKIREKDLRRALELMTDTARETAGVEIDTGS